MFATTYPSSGWKPGCRCDPEFLPRGNLQSLVLSMQMSPNGMAHPFRRRNPVYKHIVQAGAASFGQRCSATCLVACGSWGTRLELGFTPDCRVCDSWTVLGTDYASCPFQPPSPKMPAQRCSKQIGLVSTNKELQPTSPVGYASTRNTWPYRTPFKNWWCRAGQQGGMERSLWGTRTGVLSDLGVA